MEKKLSMSFSGTKQLFFRKFSRKKFAAFNSMHKVVHISTLAATCSIIFSPQAGHAQSDSSGVTKIIDLDQVDVKGKKDPLAFEELQRMVSVVSSKEIECAPSQSISDLLRYTGNIDIKQRGKNGIQSDISFRGGSFDQTMVLFNGTNLTDPQTGHLSLFLPAEIEIIKKVEVLNGSASRIYGTHAFSGAINFITTPSDVNSISFSSSFGSYNTNKHSIGINLANQKLRTLLFVENSQSEGDKPNTDYKKYNLFLQQLAFLSSGTVDFQFGAAQRAFGANSYYTPKFPDQYELNRLFFSSLSFSTGDIIKFKPKVYWRRHYDRFELFREDENWYSIENGYAISNDTTKTLYDTTAFYPHNHHINDIFGCELKLEFKSKFGESNLGFYFRSENIYSTKLGYNRGIVFPVRHYENTYYNLSDSRINFDISANQKFDYSFLHLSGGLLLNWNSYQPDEMNILPGLDFMIDLSDYLSLAASYNYTLGLPTYTDLTYEDPNNTGNNKLVPYKQHSFEGGLKSLLPFGTAAISYFYNFGSDIIDWVWVDSVKYKAINIPSMVSKGLELSTFFDLTKAFNEKFPLQSVRLNYTFINVDKDIPDMITKYAYARQMLSSMIQFRLFKGCTLSGNFSYIDREGYYLTYNKNTTKYDFHNFKPYLIIDTRISYNYKWITIFAECTNLTNKDYVDVGSIYQPGRWVTGGLNIDLVNYK